jgi:hypothetical protein
MPEESCRMNCIEIGEKKGGGGGGGVSLVQQMEQSFFKSVVETVGPMFAPGSKIIILRFQMILKQLIRSTDTNHMLIGDRNNKNGDTATTDT